MEFPGLPRYLHKDRIRLLEQLADTHEKLAEALASPEASEEEIQQAQLAAREHRTLATNEAARLAEIPEPPPMPEMQIIVVPPAEPGPPGVIEPPQPTIEPPQIPAEILQQLSQRYTQPESESLT